MTVRPQRRRFSAFSIRTLLILMTLLCAYAACWWPTKTRGVSDVDAYEGFQISGSVAIAPLVVSCDELQVVEANPHSVDPFTSVELQPVRLYYFWFFGYVIRLPYEREIGTTRLTKRTVLEAKNQARRDLEEVNRAFILEQMNHPASLKNSETGEAP